MLSKQQHCFAHAPLVAIVDLILIHLSFLALFFLRWGSEALYTSNFQAYVHVIPWLCISALVIMYACDLYANWLLRSQTDIVYLLLIASILMFVSTMAISFWDRQFALPRTVVLGAAVLQFVALAIYRLAVRAVHARKNGKSRVLIIAEDEESATASRKRLTPCAPAWMDFSEYLLTSDLSQLEDRIKQFDAALLTSKLVQQRTLIKRCARMGKTVLVVPSVQELSLLGAKPFEIGDALFLSVQPPRLTPGEVLVKRIADIVGASVLILISAPVLAIIATLVRITSGGPAIFRQERVGRDGENYTLYKFQTMVADAEKATGPVLASESDTRITPLGAILRSSRLDELPQLFNVLKGEMSLVGPRPEREFFVNQFLESVPGYDFRFGVKPGVTGLAQVFGRYSTSVERKLRFDIMYIYKYSLVLDFQILLRTVLVMLHAERAAGLIGPGFSTSIQFQEQASDSLAD